MTRFTVCNECKSCFVDTNRAIGKTPKDALRYYSQCARAEHAHKRSGVCPVTGEAVFVSYDGGPALPQKQPYTFALYGTNVVKAGCCPYFEEREDGSTLVPVGDGTPVGDEGAEQASS